MERRKFIESLPILSFLGRDFINYFDGSALADWNDVKKLFPKQDPIINLNSGSAGTMPLSVETFLIEKIREMNRGPAYKVWGDWSEAIASIKNELGDFINIPGDRLAFTRNATEALNFIINGLQLDSAKSNIIYAEHDYPNVIKAIEYRGKSTEAVPEKLPIDLASLTDNEIIERYKNSINNKTGLVVLTHLTHREGRVLPVKKITEIAHSFGAKVLLDGAQSFGHFNFDLSDLGVDFFATSLHKWFNAPLGTGFIYVKEKEDQNLAHPLYPNNNRLTNVENFGTSAYYVWAGIAASILVNKTIIPIDKKQERLSFLSNYWMEKLSAKHEVIFRHHPNSKTFGIRSFKIKNKALKPLKPILLNRYKINIKMVGTKKGSYIRVSPNVFTLEEDLDYFVDSLNQMLAGN